MLSHRGMLHSREISNLRCETSADWLLCGITDRNSTSRMTLAEREAAKQYETIATKSTLSVPQGLQWRRRSCPAAANSIQDLEANTARATFQDLSSYVGSLQVAATASLFWGFYQVECFAISWTKIIINKVLLRPATVKINGTIARSRVFQAHGWG